MNGNIGIDLTLDIWIPECIILVQVDVWLKNITVPGYLAVSVDRAHDL